MNKFLKKLAAFGLSFAMLTGIGFGFAGCSDGGKTDDPTIPPIVDPSDPNKDKEPDTQKPDKEPNTDPDKDKEPDDNKDNPPATEPKTFEEAQAEYDAFVSGLGDSFTYTLNRSTETIVAEFDGNKAKLTSGEIVTFLEHNPEQETEKKDFVYAVEEDEKWHKDFAEEKNTVTDKLSAAKNSLQGVKWAAFDKDTLIGTKEISEDGSTSSVDVTAEFKDGQLELDAQSKNCKIIVNPQSVKVDLPEDVIDDTVENDKIFTVENGEYVWNRELISKTIKDWWPKDYYQKLQSRNCDLIDILAIEYEDNTLTFLAYLSGDSGKYFQKFEFPAKSFQSMLDSGILQTSSDLLNYLNGDERYPQKIYPIHVAKAPIECEYSTLDADYETEHKKDFETLTKNIFERYHKEKTEDEPDYNGAKVLFAFKTAVGDLMKGAGGYGKLWRQYYLIEKNNKIELIYLEPWGLKSGLGWYENVLQNIEDMWQLDSIIELWSGENHGKVDKLADVSIENKDLYSGSVMTIGEIGKEKQNSKE